jgi:hypothetical protein
MTEEERRIITEFVERVGGANRMAARPASPWGALGGGSAQPAQQPLPPVDPEADRLIGDLFARHPEARYRLTQTAFVQEAALVEMQNRIQQLGVGGGERPPPGPGRAAAARHVRRHVRRWRRCPPGPMPPRPQPQYPPGYNPAMMQQGRGGSGFLGTAMMTAVGVAGGMMLGNALMGAFSGGAAEAATAGAGGFAQDAVPTGFDGGAADPSAYGSDYGADAGYAGDAGGFEDGGYEEEL